MYVIAVLAERFKPALGFDPRDLAHHELLLGCGHEMVVNIESQPCRVRRRRYARGVRVRLAQALLVSFGPDQRSDRQGAIKLLFIQTGELD